MCLSVVALTRHFQLDWATLSLFLTDCKFLECLSSALSLLLLPPCGSGCILHSDPFIRRPHLKPFSSILGHLLAPRSLFWLLQGLSQCSGSMHRLSAFGAAVIFIYKIVLPLESACPAANRCSHPDLPSRWIKSSHRLTLVGKKFLCASMKHNWALSSHSWCIFCD